jgi:tRNA1Val (adenine37-N6)-methyltransferase
MKVTTDSCLFGGIISTFAREEKVKTVLDIGTGTGLLSLMYAQKDKKAIIDAIEVDKEAAKQATENITASPWSDRIKIMHADARTYTCQRKYDMIISNPPFYEKELKAGSAQKNIAHHNDGLLLLELFEIIKRNLKPDGTFFLLLPYKRNKELETLIKKHELFIKEIIFVRQSVRHDYFRMIITGKPNGEATMKTMIGELAITNKEGNYTSEFTDLMKDYYLNL